MNIQLALIQFEGFDEGNRMLGLTTIDLPEIELEQTDIKGAGIAGTVSWPVRGNLNNLAATLHWLTLTETGASFLSQGASHMLSLRGAQEAYDAGTGERRVVGVRLDLRTHATKLSLGKFEVGEQTETELEVMIDWLKLSIDGKEVTEIDKLNYRFNVNGTDYLSDVKQVLGV